MTFGGDFTAFLRLGSGIGSIAILKYHIPASFYRRKLYNPIKRTGIITLWHTKHGSRPLSRPQTKLWTFEDPEPSAPGDVGHDW